MSEYVKKPRTCKVRDCDGAATYTSAGWLCEKHLEWKNHISDGSANKAIALYHEAHGDRTQAAASPSTLLDCPRVVWLKYKQHVPLTNPTPWGRAQRNLLGRNFENKIAEQYKEAGQLLWHWKDDVAGESVKFEMGEGESLVTGTPDLLLNLDEIVVSDSKTSRADSFLYVPLDVDEVWSDPLWFHHKMQLTAYYLLCHKNKEWFEKNSLPLPTACHLFSFALDDGVVRREFKWVPTKDDAAKVIYYTRRWNRAYASETIPDCTCEKEGMTKFCDYGYEFERTYTGYKLSTKCCKEAYQEKK